MRKAVALAFTVATLLVLAAAPAAAGPATTETIHFKDRVETLPPTTDPCSGAPGTVTTTSNGVSHITVKNGTSHTTFTQTGTFTFTPFAPGPSATGHFAIWGGFNENNQNVSGTFTFNIVGKRSDGSRISAHAVNHINTTPTGTAYFFSKFHC